MNFTDEQTREITGKIVQAPTMIAELQAQAKNAEEKKIAFQKNDTQEAVYTDEYIANINHFHNELKYLNGSQRTVYDTALIDPAARQEPSSPHWPSGYKGFIPALVPSNNGNPISAYGGDKESTHYIPLLKWMNIIKNGYQGTGVTGTATAYSMGSFIANTTGGIGVGDIVTVYTTNAGAYGTVTSVEPRQTPNSYTVTMNVEITAGSLTGTLSFTVGTSGFTNIQRVSNSTDGRLFLFRYAIDNYTGLLKTVIQSGQTELEANTSKPDAGTINSAKANNSTTINLMSNWSAAGNPRFGDTLLNPYESNIINRRDTVIPNRINEIVASLGSVSQMSVGTISGDGIYKRLMDSLIVRIHRVSGALTNYYRSDLAKFYTTEQVGIQTTVLNRDKEGFLVRLLTAEPDNTNTVQCSDISGLQVGDSVCVADNKQTIVLKYSITGITAPQKIVLSDVVPSSYTLESQVRLFKLL